MKGVLMKRGILCSGYGAQYAGMGKDLYDEYRVVQEYFEEAADCSGINFVKLCFASSDVELTEISHAAPALYLWGAAASALMRHHGITCDGIAGCDMISWYAALHSAGAVTFPDGLYIVRKWAELYTTYREQASQRVMAISSTDPAVRTMLQTYGERFQDQGIPVRISRTTPDDIVMVGDHDSLAHYADMVQREEQTIKIAYYEGHDTADLFLADDMVTQLLNYLEKIDFNEPRFPIAHPLKQGWLTTGESLKATARDICMHPFHVDFVMRVLQQMGDIICTVPSTKMRSVYTTWLPQCKIWGMDTKEELQELLRTHTIPHEEVEQ
jgi:[acyl-carrier-protein] S-malonyltransferase